MAMTEFHSALARERTGLFGVLQSIARNGDIRAFRRGRGRGPDNPDAWIQWMRA